MKNNKIFSLIKLKADKLTPKQRKLSNYLLVNAEKAAFMTIVDLSTHSGVSEPTITRFCVSLGFKKYQLFQKELQKIVKVKLSSIERFDLMKNNDDHKENDLKNKYIQKIFNNEVQIINNLFDSIEPNVFDNIIHLLSSKQKVIIVATHATACLAEYFACNLNKIRNNVFLYTSINENVYNQIDSFKVNSIALFITFPRYPRKMIELANTLYKSNIPIIGITDGIISPISDICIEKIFVPTEKTIFIDQFAAVMCLINALSMELAKVDSNRTENSLEMFESFAERNNVFIKD